MKALIKFSLFLFCFYLLHKFCGDKTDGFCLQNIYSSHPNREEWNVTSPHMPNVFDQTYSYIGCGGQCYAFVSNDGNYVLKLFKQHMRRIPSYIEYLPLPKKYATDRTSSREKRMQKLLRDYRSYKLAMENLPEETGLLYVHLNKTDDLNKKVRIRDKIGIEHEVDLDQVPFILQKKAIMAYPYFETLIHEGDVERGKEAIKSMCELIISRCSKGIFDEDAKVNRNFGFLDNKAILVDVGRLLPDLSRQSIDVQQGDLKLIMKRLGEFLGERSPDLATFLGEFLDEKAKNI